MSLEYVKFSAVNLEDPFFDSLKADYQEFEQWFAKKKDNQAYLSTNVAGAIDGFLYLKVEDEEHDDVDPPLKAKHRLKVGTFKIIAHGTKLGDRFVKKLFDQAMSVHAEELYVTVFSKHEPLIKLLSRWGFKAWGTKTGKNGTEQVLVRSMTWTGQDLHENYPLVRINQGGKYLLALYPKWHTRLLPDSKLMGEGPNVVVDISSTNSIQKIYLAGRSDAQSLKKGDVLVIYRTSDDQAPAYYRSVATSVCVVDKVQLISDFQNEEEFVKHCLPYSVFDQKELEGFYKTRRYPVVITFTYNISFPKRVTRKVMIEEVGLDAKARWTCLQISNQEFKEILAKGLVHENFIVD